MNSKPFIIIIKNLASYKANKTIQHSYFKISAVPRTFLYTKFDIAISILLLS